VSEEYSFLNTPTLGYGQDNRGYRVAFRKYQSIISATLPGILRFFVVFFSSVVLINQLLTTVPVHQSHSVIQLLLFILCH
jgi:ABC-type arginine transport system permease subunit